MDIDKELGIQSYCFRAFRKNEEVAGLIKECGLSAIELCGGLHVNFDDDSTFDGVIETYRGAGVRIVSVYVGHFNKDEKAVRSRFEFAQRAGARIISATFDLESVPESYRLVERWADKYEIKVAVHNHGGQDWLGNSQMLRHVLKNTTPRIGLCLDTAWAMTAQENPIKMAEEFGKRLYGVHLKDFVFDRAGKPADVVVGEGNLDLKKMMTLLRNLRFDGSLILEYEGDENNPVPALKACVKAIRNESRS